MISKERYRQIRRIQKIQHFTYEYEGNIHYEIENCTNISKLILNEHSETQYYTMGQLIIILNNIVNQLLKVYQVTLISLLDCNSIQVDVNDYKITFTNLHHSQSLVSYEENLIQVQRIAKEIFDFHQQSLIRLNNNKDHKNYQQLSKKIHYITEYSNIILNMMQSPQHHQELNQFVKEKIKNGQIVHDNFQDTAEAQRALQNKFAETDTQKVHQKKIGNYSNEQFQLQSQAFLIYQSGMQGSDQVSTFDQQSMYSNMNRQQKGQWDEQQLQGIQVQEPTQLETQSYIQSNVTKHKIFSFIQTNLQNFNLKEDSYEELLQFLVRKCKSFEEKQIQKIFQQLQYYFAFPKQQDKNVQESFIEEWKKLVSAQIVEDNELRFEDDVQKSNQFLVKLYEDQTQN